MKKAEVFMHGQPVGLLIEEDRNKKYRFLYHTEYAGPPVSVTLPVSQKEYDFEEFPAFFEGLLPEGINLDTLLRTKKIDRNDSFSQLLAVGADTVGAVTVKEVPK